MYLPIEKLCLDIHFLANRAKSANSMSFGPNRSTGLSSNAIVTLAYLGEKVEHLPWDEDDLMACEIMWEDLPEHRKTPKVCQAMENARNAIRKKEV